MKRLLAAATLATALLAAPATAEASDIGGSQTVGYTGLGLAAGGPLVMVGGIFMTFGGAVTALGSGGQNGGGAAGAGVIMIGVGGLSYLAGGPMLAAGSVAGANRLRAAGADISPALGYTTWGLWGLSMIGPLALNGPAAAVVGLGSYVGYLVTGGLQLGKNRRAADALAIAPKRRRQLALVPQGKGVALVGRF